MASCVHMAVIPKDIHNQHCRGMQNALSSCNVAHGIAVKKQACYQTMLSNQLPTARGASSALFYPKLD